MEAEGLRKTQCEGNPQWELPKHVHWKKAASGTGFTGLIGFFLVADISDLLVLEGNTMFSINNDNKVFLLHHLGIKFDSM